MIKRYIIGLSVVLVAAATSVDRGHACTQPPILGQNEVSIIFGGNDFAAISFGSYTTFGGGVAQLCTCALADLPSIQAVGSATVTFPTLDPNCFPLPTITFAEDAAASSAWQTLGLTGATGFNGTFQVFDNCTVQFVDVPAAIPAIITFNVQLEGGGPPSFRDGSADPQDLIDDLLNTPNVIGTAGADGSGQPDDHVEIRGVDSVDGGSVAVEESTWEHVKQLFR